VTENALKLADADGLDALTIRKLAEHLGVTPMALYWHFRSKEDLLEGVAEQVWGEIDVNTDPDAPWWAQLQGLLESLVAVLRAHSAAAQLLLEHEKRNEAALRATEVTLDVLRRAGLRSATRQRDRAQHAVDRDHARHERAGLPSRAAARGARRDAAAQPGSSWPCCPRAGTRGWSSARCR
jgi:AcrR family transcriptional regulator